MTRSRYRLDGRRSCWRVVDRCGALDIDLDLEAGVEVEVEVEVEIEVESTRGDGSHSRRTDLGCVGQRAVPAARVERSGGTAADAVCPRATTGTTDAPSGTPAFEPSAEAA